MNILLVGDGDSKYGASHSLLQLASALKCMPGNSITVILNQESLIADKLRSNGCLVEIVPYMPFYFDKSNGVLRYIVKYIIRGVQYFYGRMFAVRQIKHLMKDNSFDIIHSNSSREDFGAALAKKYCIPLVWHIREYGDGDFKCYSYRRDYIALMNENATKMIAVSEAVRLHWISKGIDKRKITTIYNGVEEKNYSVKTRDYKKNGVHFVMVGYINETKKQLQAVEALINVMNKYREYDLFLDIIGGGSKAYIKRIKQMVSSRNAKSRIRLLGYIPNVTDLLSEYDIGIVCSMEGFGRVTADYMMAGLPVVASDAGANKELIRIGVDGLLYRHDDIGDLSNKIIDIVKNIKNYGGIKTHEYTVNRFSARINADNIYRLYTDILKNNECSYTQIYSKNTNEQ